MAKGKKKTAAKAKAKVDGVPDKVAAQEAEAEELQRRLAAGESLDGSGDDNATDDNNDDDNASSAASDAATDTNNATDPDKTSNTQEYPRVDPGSVDLKPDNSQGGGDELAKLRDKFNVLEGKYNSEMARMQTALKASENVIQSQEALIKNLQSGAAQAPAGGGEDPNFTKLNPDDYASYGSEMEQMAAMVNKLVAENQRLNGILAKGTPGSQGENDRLKKVEETVQRLGGTVQLSAKQSYYNSLDNAIVDASGKPEWEKINHDPRFAQWLAQEEPLTGIIRKNILLKANQDMNAPRVISIFNEFRRSLNGGAGQMPGGKKTEAGLSEMVLPGSAGGAGDGEDVDPNATKGIVTTEQFQKAKNDFVQGKISEADFDKVAAGYQNAIAKGLIQPG